MTRKMGENRPPAGRSSSGHPKAPVSLEKAPSPTVASSLASSSMGHLALLVILACALFLINSVIFFALPGVSSAATVTPLDSCVGVDHPPFERKYSGDGRSYLNVGLTLAVPAGTPVAGTVTGNNRTVRAEGKVDADGRVYLSFPLYAYGPYQATVKDTEGNIIFQQAVTVGAQEQACDLAALDKASPPAPAPTKPEIVQFPAVPEGEDGRSVWPWIAIAVGLGLGAGGVFLVVNSGTDTKKGRCEKERQDWEAAEHRADQAHETWRQKQDLAERVSAERDELERELNQIRDTYLSAGRPDDGESWVESDGRRITGRDLAMRREADKAAMDKYSQRPSQETAQETMQEWNQNAEISSENQRKELDERARELEQKLAAARKAEKEAEKAAEEAKHADMKATRDAEAARRVYEECLLKTCSSGGEASSGGLGGGGAMIADDKGKVDQSVECQGNEPPQERNPKFLGDILLPSHINTILTGGEGHEVQKEATRISEELEKDKETLEMIKDLVDVVGINATYYYEGIGEELAQEVGKKAAESLSGRDIPTSPIDFAFGTLGMYADLASIIIKKVGEWVGRWPDCEITLEAFGRPMRVECVEVWVCRGHRWVKDRNRLKFTVTGRDRLLTKRNITGLKWEEKEAQIKIFDQRQAEQFNRVAGQIKILKSRCCS